MPITLNYNALYFLTIAGIVLLLPITLDCNALYCIVNTDNIRL